MDEIPFFYVNSLQLAMTPYDVMLEFSRVGPVASPTTAPLGSEVQLAAEVRARVTISMSPQHAKAICANLVSVVRSYEDQFGQLPVPSDVQAAFDALGKGQ